MAAIVQSSTINYSPLSNSQEIRLVILESGSGNDPILCRLFHAELENRAYEALSYEWGDASNNDPEILINGKGVRIRQNLRDALWHLRLENDGRCLWIDAMCIDQSNVLERNHQVELMGRIYSESKNTIAWLGLPMDDSDLAIDRMIEFDTLVEREGKHRISMSIERKDRYSGYLSIRSHLISFLVTIAELDAVIVIANRSYWSRMWIIQEIQLPSQLRLHCGGKSISPSSFLSFLEIGSADGGSYGYNLEGALAFFLLRRRKVREQSQHSLHYRKDGLHDWLSGCLAQPLSGHAQPFSCSEPRDIVYALLGVSGDCQNGELKPDYAKPLLEVYMDVFKLPGRQHSREDPSEIAKPKNILYSDSKLENDLALRLGLINELRHIKNKCKITRMLAEGWDPGHLHWPSGRFKLGLWDVWVVLKPVVNAVVMAVVMAVPLVLLYLCIIARIPLDWLWSKLTGRPVGFY